MKEVEIALQRNLAHDQELASSPTRLMDNYRQLRSAILDRDGAEAERLVHAQHLID